jgi:hypothetical protein
MQCNSTGDNNTSVGALSLCANTTASCNVAIGFCAMKNSTTGSENTAVGSEAIKFGTTGSFNTALGACTLGGSDVNTGNNNVAIGRKAMFDNTSGANNVAVGNDSLANNSTGNSNVAVGLNALNDNTSGIENVAISENAGCANTTGNQIVGIGYKALRQNTDGDQNVGIGAFAGCNITTGCYNTYVGAESNSSAADVLFEQVFGRGGTGKGSNTFFSGASANGVFNTANTTTWNQTSDRRIKKNIVDNNVGLDKIIQVQVRDFEYRTKDEVTDFENANAAYVDKPGVQIGVIAQEIEDIFPEMITTQSTGVKTFNPEKLVFYLINAVKELSEENKDLKSRIEALENS